MGSLFISLFMESMAGENWLYDGKEKQKIFLKIHLLTGTSEQKTLTSDWLRDRGEATISIEIIK